MSEPARTPAELVTQVQERYDAVISERMRFWTGRACARNARVPAEDGSERIAQGPCLLPPGHDGDCTPYPPSEGLPEGVLLAPWEAERLLETVEKMTTGLALIESCPSEMASDASYCAGVAMSALASLEEPWLQAARPVSRTTRQEPAPPAVPVERGEA